MNHWTFPGKNHFRRKWVIFGKRRIFGNRFFTIIVHSRKRHIPETKLFSKRASDTELPFCQNMTIFRMPETEWKENFPEWHNNFRMPFISFPVNTNILPYTDSYRIWQSVIPWQRWTLLEIYIKPFSNLKQVIYSGLFSIYWWDLLKNYCFTYRLKMIKFNNNLIIKSFYFNETYLLKFLVIVACMFLQNISINAQPIYILALDSIEVHNLRRLLNMQYVLHCIYSISFDNLNHLLAIFML